MPTYSNFSSLVSDVSNYLERGGSSATDNTVLQQIPRLINAAERKIVQILKLQGVIEVLVDQAGLPANVAVVGKPDRWRQTKSLKYAGGSDGVSYIPLYPRNYDFCRMYWPNDSKTSAPQFYADYDYFHWLIAPTPDITYPLEAVCYMQPPLLDQANQTNFFTNYTPNLLLYLTMLEATPFMKDDSRVPMWQSYADREVASLITQDLQKIMDQASQRSGA